MRSCHFRLLPALLLALLVGCGDGATAPEDQEGQPSTTGTLVFTVSGLPKGANAQVVLAGPNGFSRTASGDLSLTGLVPGVYSATVSDVSAEGLSYGTAQALRYVEVVAGGSAVLKVEYRPFNLQVDNFYITQSIQKYDRSIPLIAGRDGLLRVFVRANNTNTVKASVRVRLYQNGVLTKTLDIASPSFAVPLETAEAALASTWNVLLPGSLVQTGLSVRVDVNSDSAEGDSTDNQYPASGQPQPLDVRKVPVLDLVLIPIQQGDGTVGNVTEANKDRYTTDLLRMFPVAESRVSVRAPYITSTQLRAGSEGSRGWSQLLQDLEAIRVGDGRTGQYYYGVAKLNYTAGIYGIAYRPGKTALGNDFLDDRNLNASMTLAHELGHSMGRPHSQCGSAGFPDVDYPHPNGQIGSFGLDLLTRRLYGPDTKDLMGYCEDRWIGDYTYLKVLEHRATVESTLGVSSSVREPSLVVWGRVGSGGLSVQPAFEVETYPALPQQPGPYQLEGLDQQGTPLFSISFSGNEIDHAAPGERVFAFAVPRRMFRNGQLAALRLKGDGREVVRRSTGSGANRVGKPKSWKIDRGPGGRPRLQWDSASHPLVVVRDPSTGDIISLSRTGSAGLPADARPLEVILSDGVRSVSQDVVH